MRKIDVSLIVPSYNESWDIKRLAIDEIDSYLHKQKYSYEVLIVDDKSTNGTLEKVKEYLKSKNNFKLIQNEHGGKAITVMTGMIASEGKLAVFTDMDQATPIEELDKLLEKFEEGNDLVIGSRKGRRGAPVSRKLAAWGFALMRNIILGLPFKDTQCGFKAFNRKAIDEIFVPLLGIWKKIKASNAAVNAGFDVETLYLAKKKGFKISEVEVLWHHVQNEKQVQILKDGLEAIKDMFRIRLNDLSGKYG